MGVLFLFATEAEVAHTLTKLHCKPTGQRDFYSWDGGHVAVSGIGCLAAATCIARHTQGITQIINLGAAGTLQPNLALKSIVSIKQVMRSHLVPEEMDAYSSAFHTKLFAPLSLAGPGLRLISSDYPIHHPALQEKLAQHADLVDMEAYGAAFAAEQLKIPLEIVKVVSDFADARGPALIRELLDEVSYRLSEIAEGYANVGLSGPGPSRPTGPAGRSGHGHNPSVQVQ